MGTPLEDTWIPRIECWNHKCTVMPKSKFVPIRKSQRSSPEILEEKITKVVGFWNSGNCGYKNEGFMIDCEEIADDFKNRKIGLPGHRQE